MKEFIIVTVCLLLVFIPNFLFKDYLENTGNELLSILDEMGDDISSLSGADESKSIKLKETFLEKEKGWILIVDHEMLDEIENGIEECIAFYNDGDEMEFESACGKLRNNIEDLYRREEISIVNIL